MKHILIPLTVSLLAAPSLHAQLVADGATNTLANVTNTTTGSVTIGTNGSFTLLVLSDNALLTNSVNGLIGRNNGANSNEVRVVSPTARWFMGGSIFVGNNGGVNRLVVSNGATVLAGGSGTIGYGADFTGNANSNSVTVSGAGSVWSNGLELVIGELGFANRLEVNGGAWVVNGSAFVGRSIFSPSNTVLVTGAGSVWSNRADVSLGGVGSGNLLVVSNGGWMVNSNASIGASSLGNLALLTGPGSTWNNRGNLFVGNGARENQMVVSNGALVVVGGNAVIGENLNGTGNSVLVDGPSAQWLVSSNLFVGNNGSLNRLVITNGGMVTNALLGAAGYNAASSSNEIVVAGPGSIWHSQLAYVGLGGSSNRLTISDGGLVTGTYGVIGVNATASNNLALVVGAGSVWSNALQFWVGASSSGNRLVISQGGGVFSSEIGYIGVNSTSLSNLVTVTDPGSFWSYGAAMRVGRQGSGNILVVSNGAWIGGVAGTIGEFDIASNNLAVVTGAGSFWTNAGNLYVGSNGAFSSLVVSNGARVTDQFGFVGWGPPSSNNLALVTGAGSSWTNLQSLYLGGSGSGNRLVISNGGKVSDIGGIIGFEASSKNNEAVVTDPGSLWANGGVIVGSSGSGNRLVVSNAATVTVNVAVTIGGNTSATNNRVVVDGGTLRATNFLGTGTLDVRRGTNVFNAGLINVDVLLLTNTLGQFEFNGGTLITRGAVISNGLPFTVGAGGSSPAVWNVQAGPASHFVSGELDVGGAGSFAQLIHTNGALLTNDGFASLGLTSTSRSNSVTLGGAASRWSLNGGVAVGELGSANQLLVRDGAALVTGNFSYVGFDTGSSNNEAVVTGPGSSWTSGAGNVLYVGRRGRNNRLVISAGALVTDGIGIIGDDTAATNNLALITGPGSLWSHGTALIVGRLGAANQLIVSNGATVFSAGNIMVGADATATGNRVVVDSGSLIVTNAATNGLLEIRRGTNVLNAGLIEVDILRVTNLASSRLVFNGGTLSAKSSQLSLGLPFTIGNGVSPATFHLAGNGTHNMPSTLGLVISPNATLTGNGSLIVQLQVQAGGRLSPGASVGKISLSTPPSLAGTVLMEISKAGATLTNDQVQVTGTLTYGGALVVTNIGGTALAAGDRFPLFSAASYAGSFASLTLPSLPTPLSWKNNLLVDGSIEVAAPPALAMSTLSNGSYTQDFNSLALSGGANPWRDNSTLLGWYAARTVAPTNIVNYIASDGSGNAGALYSFGTTGSGERALGSIGSDSVGDIGYGLGLTNDTGITVSNFKITFTGEQWRNASGAVTNTLTFWHRVSPFALTNPEPGSVTNWTQVTNLNFVSPTVTAAGTALDGNAAGNRNTFASVSIPGLVVPPGQTVFFRWLDENDTGTDQGLAVDDVVVSFGALVRDFGVDVSHFQNESGVPQSSWDQMFVEGKRFVFIKATEGLTGPHDPTMATNVARATAAGLLAGVYHFAHPENRPTPAGAVLEASNMVVYAGSAIGAGRLRPVLDLERGSNLTTTELTDWVIAFSDEIILRRGPGAAPILYCTQTFANNELDSRLAGYDLWLRTIGTSANPAVDDPPAQGVFTSATGVFTNWSFWQYSSTGSSGGITPLDLNVCHNEFKPLSSFIIPDLTPTAIQLTGMTASLGGTFEISFTNTPGARFTVLSATNVTLPASNWTIIGPVTEVSPGRFRFTDTNAPSFPTRFYRVLFP